MASAQLDGSSCSQNRSTTQPAASSIWSVSVSRARLRSNFHAHHSELVRGWVPCSGQPCQKQPSTNTEMRERGKAMSIVRRALPGILSWTRNLRPRRWSSRRSRSSGRVPDLARRDIFLERAPPGLVRDGSSCFMLPVCACRRLRMSVRVSRVSAGGDRDGCLVDVRRVEQRDR